LLAIERAPSEHVDGTAKKVTTRMEEMRIEAQRAIEKDKMETQKALDSEKQRMELYKALYTERIAASKELMRVTGAMQRKATECYIEGHTKEDIEEVTRLGFEIVHFVNAHEWLLTEDVSQNATMVQAYSLVLSGQKLDKEASDGAQSFLRLTEARKQLAMSISEMMHNNDLSRLVKK
jgi:hypothetical protein